MLLHYLVKVETQKMHMNIVRHQHAHMISVTPLVNCSVANGLFKAKPSLHQAFLQVIDVMNLCFVYEYTHCCITPRISKYNAHDDPGPSMKLWYIWCNFLVICCCNIRFSVYRFSQGSVAILIRWVCVCVWNSYRNMYRSFLDGSPYAMGPLSDMSVCL